MQSVCLKEFIRYFPHVPREYVQNLYTQPFHSQDLPRVFEGWEYYEYCHCYIDNSEERNIIRFDDSGYLINAQAFKTPANLNDFIRDCQVAGVKLLWSEAMADKLWFTPPLNLRN